MYSTKHMRPLEDYVQGSALRKRLRNSLFVWDKWSFLHRPHRRIKFKFMSITAICFSCHCLQMSLFVIYLA